MAILKCKMCGGELNIQDGMTVAECEYCGTTQTLPKLVSDDIANLYDRANHFRRNNEFDKAEGIYERILSQTPEDAEAYWSLVLCRYGIEYVEDPATHKRVPTVNRAQYTSIFDDENYKSAIEHADAVQRRVYEEEAAAINEIQKGILAISQKEEPFDVFICYKESDNNGRRTPDSVLATDLYHQLTNEGFKVFFSRITLEDKLGTAYEPYIFAALNSAKVMVVLGTKPEYFNAVWVKNEWSRYLALVKQSGGKKVLIPAYRDMDPYDLPEEFSHLQAQDMSKLGFMQDLIRGIKKITGSDQPKPVQPQAAAVNPVSAGSADIAPLLKRMFMYLEDGEWDKANEYSERVLDKDPENAEAYLGKLMVDLKVRQRKELKNQAQPFDGNKNYNKAIRFADAALKNELTGYIDFINNRNAEEKRRQEEEKRRKEEERLRRIEEHNERVYSDAVFKMNKATTVDEFQIAAQLFDDIIKYKDSAELSKKCKNEAELLRKQADYSDALSQMNKASTEAEYKQAAESFRAISDYKDASSLAKQCEEKAEAARKDTIYSQATAEMKKDSLEGYFAAKEKLNSIKGWKDADEQLSVCETRISELTAKKEEEDRIAAEKKKKRIITIGSIAAAVVALVVAFVIVLNTVIIPNNLRNEAKTFEENGQYLQAANKYMKAGSTEKAKSLYWECSRKTIISAGKFHTVGLKADGTVVATGSTNSGQCDVSKWSNIIAVSAGDMHSIGLKADGTVVAVGRNGYGQCNVQDWTDIVAVSAGDFRTVGLKSDGTVVATDYSGNKSFNRGQFDVQDWTDIVAVSTGEYHTVGLKSNGTVVAVGDNNFGQCNVHGWKDIVAVSAGSAHTVGLKADGTVVAVGYNNNSQCDVASWTDIVAVSAGGYHTAGLKSDGTVVATNFKETEDSKNYGQCNVSDWKDIVAISAGSKHTVGYTSDGEVVAVGNNSSGQCNVSDWILW